MENAFLNSLVVGAVLLGCAVFSALAGDPDALFDFIVPPGVMPANVSANNFTFRATKADFVAGKLIVQKISLAELPTLDGAGVSMATLMFPPSVADPVHFHQRASELLQVTSGSLFVSFIDSLGRRFDQKLFAGDAFLFPKGMLHYQINLDPKKPAHAVAVFGSSNPGIVLLGPTLFGSGLNVEVLHQSFNISKETIEKLVAANTPHPL
ncbi:hypothetical protein O6H91_06G040300 [Diphasiastrum complanatum]|uniref:Uncharacterized protein n=1 Tax=Diphasiastrum complanatum TaxID=34168 RepID=A0ACC2DD64_DIPCM|nr:hypothetical protein O6H91_Y500200 [Diphasiastrum complanatum]KAJ7552067.1 hypothetical protein O6H91_06G040300 [Diphasiastrum complanatum]